MKKIPVIPDCYKDLPDKTYLSSKEVAKMFNYANANSLTSSKNENVIPKHDCALVSKCSASGCGTKFSYYWKLGTIRKWKNDYSI